MTDLNLFLALGAGFLSFISPCCLPLYPAFLSYITGMSVGELKSDNGMLSKKKLNTYDLFSHRFLHYLYSDRIRYIFCWAILYPVPRFNSSNWSHLYYFIWFYGYWLY